MKKIISVIITMSIIIGLVYLYKNTDILDFVTCEEITIQDRQQYSNRWYYNNLTEQQKEIYLYLAKGIDHIESNIKFKINAVLLDEEIEQDINSAIEAYIYDYPEAFYLNSTYKYKVINMLSSKVIEIQLEYIDEKNIKEKQRKLQEEIDNIRSMLKPNMSDYTKELIVHDYLIDNISYYEWEDIEDIPEDRHTAYSALVNKQAVCDGITRAFQLIMIQEGLECITALGELEDVAHAWNIIKIDNDYYHVDLTSNKVKFKKEVNDTNVHVFFNITDNEIKQTHIINKKYRYPVCNSVENNYYYRENKIIKENQNLKNRVMKLASDITDEKILEIRVLNRKDVATEIAQALYDLDFNRYKTDKVETISYTKTRDTYIYKIK